MPRTNSSMEETITSQSSTLPVAFDGGFFAKFVKTGVFKYKMRPKTTSTVYLLA